MTSRLRARAEGYGGLRANLYFTVTVATMRG
jgi:hypothetical protein